MITASTTNRTEALDIIASALFEPADMIEIRCLRSGKTKQFWCTAGDLPGKAEQLAKLNADGWNIYVGANPRTRRGGASAADVEMARCLFLDFDNNATVESVLQLLASLGIPLPTLMVFSGHGVHCYWRLQEPIYDMEFWTAFQKDAIRLAGSDQAIHDPSRIMRLPSFLNLKYEPHVLAEIVEFRPERVFDLSELACVFPEAPEPPTADPTPSTDYVRPTGVDVIELARRYIAKIKPSIQGQNGSSPTFRAACVLVEGYALSPEQAFPLLKEYSDSKCQPPWEDWQLKHKLDDAAKKPNRGYMLRRERPQRGAVNLGVQDQTGTSTSLPTVELSHLEFKSVAQGIAALAAAGPSSSIFQRSGELVRITRSHKTDKRGVNRSENSPVIGSCPNAFLRTALTEHANIVCAKVVKEKGQEDRTELVSASPPPWLVDAIEAAGEWKDLPYLKVVVESPVLLADGRVLQTAGHDADSGILYEPASTFPPVPDAPSCRDVTQAVARLSEVVADFPFESDHHVSAWFASLLTPIARFAFDGPSPMFVTDANCAGTGKGKLNDVAAEIAIGREFSKSSYIHNNAEIDKRILSIALAGDRCVMFDNVSGPFGVPALDAALTATSWQGRKLSVSESPRVPLYTIFYATANNVTLVGDTARRICHIRLRTPEERPEDRQDFKHPNLLQFVRQNREKLLVDALTILRGWFAAGKPDQKLPPWGSFEGWSHIIRNTLVWAGFPDPVPVQARRELAELSDTGRNLLGMLISAWDELDPERLGMTAPEAIRRLEAAGQDAFPIARQVFAEMAPNGSSIPSAKSLGHTLKGQRERIHDGKSFCGKKNRVNLMVWSVNQAPLVPA